MFPDAEDYGNPTVVVVFSGKRKSGKDYVSNLLLERLGSDNCALIRLSAPLKERYALENNLNYEKLLDSSEYKETFRQKMIEWGENIRNKDPGYFCRHAIIQSNAKFKNIWIVSDARRKSDIIFFLHNFPEATLAVRINASDSIRQLRGWKFTEGVDDRESECGLDDYLNWNFNILNESQDKLQEDIDKMFCLISSKLMKQ